MKIAEAFVELRSDDRVAKAEVQKQAKGLGSQFAQIFGAAAFGAGLKKSIDAASDLNETVSKTRVVFGGASGEIEKFAATAATSMGMSKKAYLDAASGLKGLLTNLGLADDQSTKYAQSLTGLGADLASFFNTDPADAIDAISSALRGEVEPIRKYNVNINDAAVKTKAFEMGLYSGKGAIDANAKAQATLALITDQTASAQGDFARTADGVANSQRIAKAEAENAAASLGQNFLPIYQRVVEVVGFLAEKFAALPAPVQLGFVALTGLVALAGPIGSLKTVISSVVTSFQNMGTVGRASVGALGAVGAILTVAAIAYGDYQDQKAKAAAVTQDFVAALKAEASGQKDAARAAIGVKIADKELVDLTKQYGLTTEQVADFIAGKHVPALDQLTDSYGQVGILAGSAGNDLIALSNGYTINSKDAAVLSKKILDLRDSFVEANDQVVLSDQVNAQLGVTTDGTTRALQREAGANAELASATEVTRGKFEEAATAADDLKKAIDAVFSPYMDLEEANRNIQQGLADVTQSLKDNGTTLDINTDKGRANRQAIEDQVKGILDFSVALVNQGASSEDAANATAMLTQQLHDQLKAAGLTEDQIASYLDTLGLTPANVRTTIELAEADKRKRELDDLLGQLGDIDAGAKAEIQANIDQGKFDEADAKINALAKDRGITLKVSLTGGGTVDINTIGSKIYVKAHAQGAYIGAPELATLGEGGRPEAVLPLTNRRRMAALLGDPRIGGPVMDALGSAGAGGVAVASSTVTHHHSHTWQIWGTERSYVADLMRKFEILASGG